MDIEEVEELGTDEMVAVEEPPVAVAVMEEEEAPAVTSGDGELVAELEAEVAALHERLDIVKKERRAALETILRELDELAARVRAQLE